MLCSSSSSSSNSSSSSSSSNSSSSGSSSIKFCFQQNTTMKQYQEKHCVDIRKHIETLLHLSVVNREAAGLIKLATKCYASYIRFTVICDHVLAAVCEITFQEKQTINAKPVVFEFGQCVVIYMCNN